MMSNHNQTPHECGAPATGTSGRRESPTPGSKQRNRHALAAKGRDPSPPSNQRSEPDEPLWDEIRTAAYLGLQRTCLQKWRWAGQGPPFVKIGSAVRYRPHDVRAYVVARLRTSTSDKGSVA